MLSRRLLRVKVVKALFGHLKSDSTNMIASEKTLLASIDKTYDLYFQLMELIVEVRRHAESRLETARRKKLPTYEDLNPNTKFVENKAIALLASSQTVNDYLSSHKLNWARYPELIKLLYTRLLASDYYRRYMQNPTRTFSEDKQLVEEFYRNELEDCEELEAALEEQSILWSDDLGFALTMVVRTLSNLRASSTDVKVLPKFKSDDDLAFVKTLFEKVLVNYDQTQRYIERFTSNWDIERIAFMDYLILATAVAELTSCPEIPVKVTLDEYIEISKYYSGPGSSVFDQRRARQTGRRADRGGENPENGAGPHLAMRRLRSAFGAGCAAVGVALVLLCGCGSRSGHRTFSGPIIAVSAESLHTDMSDTLRFGRLHSGETARLEAGFCNRGGEPLVVVRSESSCGCTSLEYDAQPIMPGDTLRVAVRFDTSGQRGWLFKVLRVYFSGGERPLRLYVEADVQ